MKKDYKQNILDCINIVNKHIFAMYIAFFLGGSVTIVLLIIDGITVIKLFALLSYAIFFLITRSLHLRNRAPFSDIKKDTHSISIAIKNYSDVEVFILFLLLNKNYKNDVLYDELAIQMERCKLIEIKDEIYSLTLVSTITSKNSYSFLFPKFIFTLGKKLARGNYITLLNDKVYYQHNKSDSSEIIVSFYRNGDKQQIKINSSEAPLWIETLEMAGVRKLAK